MRPAPERAAGTPDPGTPGPRRVIALTGTRADFGKMRDVLLGAQEDPRIDLSVIVTGMHLLHRYGYTVHEIEQSGLTRLHHVPNQVEDEPMALVLSTTVGLVARLLIAEQADMVLVHGDRVEALAGALAGSLSNVRVAHVEGGEVSGTIDDAIRHSLSKHAHVHFVSNEEARRRLLQLGEEDRRIKVVGSPEGDALAEAMDADLEPVRRRYGIPEGPYGILLLHPVTTEPADNRRHAEAVVRGVLDAGGRWVVVDPNNDEGTRDVHRALDALDGVPGVVRLPSMRFHAFLALLRHAEVMVGNSSSGVREAPVLGTPSVDVGSRQHGRSTASSVRHVAPDAAAVTAAIRAARAAGRSVPEQHFGNAGSAKRILAELCDESVWELPLQKVFVDQPR
jgi:UDP-N-acetylglucosamine 2-epimerase (hydrolysing)